MKKFNLCVVSAVLALTVSYAFATEPVNLNIRKQEMKRYHDSGEYVKDLNAVGKRALSYLDQRIKEAKNSNKKLAIVLDIDETSLSNYPNMIKLDFGGTLDDITQKQDKAKDPVIETTLKLYNEAITHHVAVFFITGRFEFERDPTSENLKAAGFSNWDKLILRDEQYKTAPAADYKTAKRKEIEAQGYDIVVNMGDQQSDLRGGYADEGFKLPNPYYFIP